MAKHNQPETSVRVLVLEDDPTQLETLVALVEEEGLKAVGCSRSHEAFARIEEGDIDVAVVDLHLPDISGVELLDNLSAYSNRVSIIINTGFSSYESASAAVNLGAFAYVEKGSTPENLIRHLHRATQSRLRHYTEHLEAVVGERTRELPKSEQQYRRLIDELHLGMAQMDTEHNIVMVNESLARLLRTSPSQLVGKKCYQVFVKREEICAHCPGVPAMETGESRLVENRGILDDGSTIYVRNQAFPTHAPGGDLTGFVELVEDITDRKRLEEQLRDTQKMEAVGQLAAGVAHEFNNLLFGILGSAELILATAEGEIPEHFKRPLEDIKKCGQRGADLTRQLLSFARKKDPEKSLFDINQVLSDVESMLGQSVGECITLETVLASDLPLIQADKVLVEQAIINLARNACDAMPDGGTLTIRTATETFDEARVSGNPRACPGLYVRLSFADTGCGMSPETAERVFEPFFTTKPMGKGTGLGLSTVFADITRCGGIIEVESRQGNGTVFRVYLRAAEAAIVTPSDDTDFFTAQCPGGSETILVVDDDEAVLNSAAFLLESQGYFLIRALGAREAIEAAAAHAGTIELLLTDVTMPDMNGWQLAKRITKQRPDMKVIFMSGYAEDVLKASAAKGEHIEFLQKPPMRNILLERVREVLDAPERRPGR